MSIVGFNYKKILAERKKPIAGKINVQNNVKIEDIRETKLMVGEKENKTLTFDFRYASEYDPDIGSIEILGSLVYMAPADKVDEIIKEWKGKEKKVPQEIMAPVLNTILDKCSISALTLTKEVNLPPQISLPKVKVKE